MAKNYRLLPLMRSDLAEIAWPPVSTGTTATLAALVARLEDTQWLSPEELAASQRRQLGILARYATRHSPYFRQRLNSAGLDDGAAGADWLRRLPVLTRRNLQTAGDGLFCVEIPRNHRPVSETQTSGSTGEPVKVRRTGINRLFWLAMTMRDHLWHSRDFSGKFSAIRANIPSYALHRDWGAPMSLLFKTGPSQAIPITSDVGRQVEWLQSFQPNYLLIYPNSLDALSRHCGEHGICIAALRDIRTIGETLSPRVRQQAEAVFGARVSDIYSSQEVGNIAVQCPESGLYHVMSESLIVEVLDDTGQACREGEVGRITVTDLHNFATPLVRYDIGDYAEVAGPCPCGRGLPALKRILGRERNLILMPDGTRHWPLVGFSRFRDVAPISQYQLIQHQPDSIEVRLVAEAAVTAQQENALAEVIREALGFPFDLRFTYFENEIPKSASGKFEEFVCRVSRSAAG